MAEVSSTAPAAGAKTVTPSDSTVVNCRGLYVGTTGDVAVTTARGDVVTFKTVPVGLLPIQCQKVMSTNTTASNILALF